MQKVLKMKKILSILFFWSLSCVVFAQDPPVDFANFDIVNYTAKTVCFKSTIEFINKSTPDTITHTYVWDFGDNSKKDTTYSLLSNIKHTYNKDGKFSVTLSIIDTSNNDTLLSQKKRPNAITIYKPTAEAFDIKVDDFQTFQYTFTPSKSFAPFDSSAWQYDWYFGDDTFVEDSVIPEKIYAKENFTTGYSVKMVLRLKDNIKLSNNKTAECRDSIIQIIKVRDGFFKGDSATRKALIPNIFTPNGQHDKFTFSLEDTTDASLIKNNDIFAIKTNGINIFKLWIYNRWGNLIYKTESYKIDWDGKSSNGEDVSSGVYYYVIESDASDKKHKTAGVIHLFRE